MAKPHTPRAVGWLDSLSRWFRGLCRFVVLTAIMAGTMLIFIDVGQFFFQSSDFSIKEISVEGTLRLLPEEIQLRAEIMPGTNIWLVNLHKMEERIAAHPTIASAQVQRIPPHRLHIRIEERLPFAYMWNAETERFYGIDETGVVCTQVAAGDAAGMRKHQREWDDFLSHPVISTHGEVSVVLGKALQSNRIHETLDFLKKLKKQSKTFFSELSECEIQKDESIIFHPKRRIGAIIIRSLDAPDLDKKLSAFWAVLEKHDLRAIYVDARFPDHGFAVRWDETNERDWKQLYHNEVNVISSL